MENLKSLIHGVDISTYQRGLAFQEFDKLIEKAKQYDEIKTKIAGYYKHNNNLFGPRLLESIGEDIVKSFGYEVNY